MTDVTTTAPKRNASHEAWVDYAVSLGHDRAEAEALSRDELVELLAEIPGFPAGYHGGHTGVLEEVTGRAASHSPFAAMADSNLLREAPGEDTPAEGGEELRGQPDERASSEASPADASGSDAGPTSDPVTDPDTTPPVAGDTTDPTAPEEE